MTDQSKKTIAIVGGGVAGLYAAWKILCEKKIPNVNVHVYESTKECSGRIYTAWNYQGFPIELGAARFSKDVHPILTYLVKHFEFKTMPYVFASRFWFLRNKKLSLADIASGKAPYNMPESEVGQYSDHLFEHAEKHTKRSTAEINAMSFHEFLAEHISEEACTFFRDVEGYDLLLGDWLSGMDGVRAIKQHPDMLPKEDGGWFHIVGGFHELIKTLQKQILENGGKIFLKHRLIEVAQNSDSVTLFMEVDENNDTSVKSFEFDRAILTIKRVDFDNVQMNLSDEYRQAMEAVQPIPMVKMFATYNSSWWETFARKDGNFCITDMPIRKIYYGPGHHLMFYSDCESANYWKDFIDESGKNPDAVLNEVQNQLSKIYKMPPDKLPRPNAFYSKYWSTGIHVWRRNSDPVAVRTTLMGKPTDRVHIASEAFAVNAGWVEGALESVALLIDTVIYP